MWIRMEAAATMRFPSAHLAADPVAALRLSRPSTGTHRRFFSGASRASRTSASCPTAGAPPCHPVLMHPFKKRLRSIYLQMLNHVQVAVPTVHGGSEVLFLAEYAQVCLLLVILLLCVCMARNCCNREVLLLYGVKLLQLEIRFGDIKIGRSNRKLVEKISMNSRAKIESIDGHREDNICKVLENMMLLSPMSLQFELICNYRITISDLKCHHILVNHDSQVIVWRSSEQEEVGHKHYATCCSMFRRWFEDASAGDVRAFPFGLFHQWQMREPLLLDLRFDGKDILQLSSVMFITNLQLSSSKPQVQMPIRPPRESLGILLTSTLSGAHEDCSRGSASGFSSDPPSGSLCSLPHPRCVAHLAFLQLVPPGTLSSNSVSQSPVLSVPCNSVP